MYFKHMGARVVWIDVAIVKTDDYGDVSTFIPTLSGLTDEDLNYPDLWFEVSFVEDGTYIVAVVIKDIGSGGDTPACYGASPNMLSPVDELYETALLYFTT